MLLTSGNYREPQQLSALTLALQKAARNAGHPAPIVAAGQEGGAFSAFGNLAPLGAGRRRQRAQGDARESALGRGPPAARAGRRR